jgi:uncharacterized metal-binding protein YceD (DUF177 family)
MTPPPELHRPVPLDRIAPGGLTVTVEATADEGRALARRLAIPGVAGLLCRFVLRQVSGGTIEAAGTLHARVTRTCVVTLEDFDADVDETFALHFVPEGSESDDDDPESPDEIGYAGDSLDLGEAAVEQLALALDPYPRAPGAALPVLDQAGEGDVSAPNPFAALGRLRRGPGPE